MKALVHTLVLFFLCMITACSQPDRRQVDTSRGPASAPPDDGFPMSASPGGEPATTSDENTPVARNGHARPIPPYVLVPVFYATDRKPVLSIDEWRRERRSNGSAVEYYGKDWSERLELGRCNVSIPTRVHQTGEVERPRFYQSESVEKHFVILSMEPTSSTNYFARLRSRIEKSDEEDAFVFIHGYNVTFANAVMRTAQIAHDVGFKGAPILYSWPSAGRTDDYLRDEDSVRLTVEHLKAFLTDITHHAAPRKLHLVAHSMGNRALTEVLHHFVRTEGKPIFNEIILAAPDVNRTLFLTQILPKIRGQGTE